MLFVPFGNGELKHWDIKSAARLQDEAGMGQGTDPKNLALMRKQPQNPGDAFQSTWSSKLRYLGVRQGQEPKSDPLGAISITPVGGKIGLAYL